jgi:hypothetical protein
MLKWMRLAETASVHAERRSRDGKDQPQSTGSRHSSDGGSEVSATWHSDFRGFWPEQVVQHFNFTSRRARQFIHDLQAEGLIEPSTHEFDKDAYQLTDRGRSLGRGSAAKAIFRATGDKALEGLLRREKEVNASDDFLCSVEAVVLFGSYLKGEESPNDLT